jgi:hypothetical protein
MSVTISGTTGVATPGVQNSADETIAGTLTVTGATTAGVIKSTSTSQPSTFQNSAGTEIGTLCRAWVNFGYVSSAITVRANFNVASVVRNSTGDYTITFTNPLPDANYSVCFANIGYTTANISTTTVIKGVIGTGATNKTASALTIQTGSTASGGLLDCADISVNIFR